MRRKRNRATPRLDIPAKANRVLNIILIAIMMIVLRVWHLSVVQHEDRLEEARRPQRKVVIEPAKRGTIRDRFNLPLAINKVQYNAAVLYAEIQQVPSVVWRKEGGKKVKIYQRKEYILKLADLLGRELGLEPERVDDLIHSKAALYNNLPYVIKENISEEQFYRLKMLERDWLGIHTQCVPVRHYPWGKVGGDIIGYMGAISKGEYEGIIQELKSLQNFLKADEQGEHVDAPPGVLSAEEARCRLQDLTEHAYSINDYVGKTGIEGKFEEKLRGYHGKKSYHSDARGNYLRELPGAKEPLSGKRMLLTLSAELQEFAEELLIQNERIRVPRVSGVDAADRKKLEEKPHWIKGGAIVAMDPFSGDVLALASYPRFDPNDFISTGNPEEKEKKNRRIRGWFETPGYLGEIWDQKRPLEKEVYFPEKQSFGQERTWVDWDAYLAFILPHEGIVYHAVKRVGTIERAVHLQKSLCRLMELTGQDSVYALINLLYQGPQHIPFGRRLPAVQQEALEEALLENAEEVLEIKEELDPYFSGITQNYDKVLLVDLCRLVVDEDKLSLPVLKKNGRQSLGFYRQCSAAWCQLEEVLRKMSEDLYHIHHFRPWRAAHQKEFLKARRAEEKAAGKKYAKPYIDLLDEQEAEMFQAFWENYRFDLTWAFLSGETGGSREELEPYLKYFQTWHQELEQGAHQKIKWGKVYWTVRKATDMLSQAETASYLSSLRTYQDLNKPLLGRYRYIGSERGMQFEKHLAAAFYPLYGYGFARSHAYRQAAVQGSIFKVVTAYEALVQQYQRGAVANLNPLVMTDDTHKRGKAVYVGYDAQGKDIPQLYKGGRIPRSHRSGLGKVDLVRALEISSNPYFSLLAVDHLNDPNDLSRAAKKFCFGKKTGIELPAEIAGRVPNDLDVNRNGLYAMAIGQHSLVVTPLQTAVMLSAIANGGYILKPRIVNMTIGKSVEREGEADACHMQNVVMTYPTEVRSRIFMPDVVREVLLEGMYRVVKRSAASAWGSLGSMYADYPEAITDLLDMKDQMLGKSSTAEAMEPLDLDLKLGTNLYNHIWFGGIVYDAAQSKGSEAFVVKDKYGQPELVVVVYLRYGAWGKDASPLAAQVAKKWRQIKAKMSKK